MSLALTVFLSSMTPLLCGLSLLISFPTRPFSWLSYTVWLLAVGVVLCALFRLTRWDFLGHVGLWATTALLACAFLARGYLAGADWTFPSRKVLLLSGACAAAAGLLLYAIHHRPSDAGAVSLQMPMQDARWHVAQGGSMRLINHHAGVPAQRWAVDLTAVGPDGRRASGLAPSDLDAYVTFGKPVVSPCDGVIVATENTMADLPLGQTDAERPGGNFVAIECQRAVVVLAHLRQGSAQLEVGAVVRTGQLVGRVGNSGNTSEPHLHVHAVRGRHTSIEALFFEGDGVPMLFGDRLLIRGDTGGESRH